MQPATGSAPASQGKRNTFPWIEMLFGLVGMGGLLFINQGLGFVLVIFLFPLLGEWLLLKGAGMGGAGAALALIPVSLAVLGGGVGVAFALYGSLAAWLLSPWTPVKSVRMRSVLWGVMTMGMMMFLLYQAFGSFRSLNPSYTGGLMDFLADWFTASIAQSPQGNELLVAAYQAGYAHYGTSGEGLPAFRLGGLVILSDEVRTQLLLSLRHTLWVAFHQSAPQGVLYAGGCVALFSALVAGGQRRRRGLQCDVPPFSRWHLPRGWGLRIGVLALGYLFQGDGTPPMVGYISVLSVAIFRFAYTVQGIAALQFFLARSGSRWLGKLLVTGAGLWLAPDLFQIIGIFDQISPWRQLRKKQQEG